MKLIKGYKLFEQDPQGNLYALFIDKKTVMPMDTWIPAKNHPTKGFSVRPGIHLGEIPSAPWLMSADGTYKSQRGKYWKRVWGEVWFNADIDYTPFVQQLPQKCFVDKIPEGGFYKFKEAGLNRIWFICDRMKITRLLSEEERMQILADMQYNEAEVAKPYIDAIKKRMKVV